MSRIIQNDMLWVCGWYVDEHTGEWAITGVFSTEALAAAACDDESYFIGPLLLDAVAGEDDESSDQWPGMYRPLVN